MHICIGLCGSSLESDQLDVFVVLIILFLRLRVFLLCFTALLPYNFVVHIIFESFYQPSNCLPASSMPFF